MTSSPGLCGWSRLQARRGMLQTTTDEWRQTTTDSREQNNTAPYTMCRRASNNISTRMNRRRYLTVDRWISYVPVADEKNLGLHRLSSKNWLYPSPPPHIFSGYGAAAEWVSNDGPSRTALAQTFWCSSACLFAVRTSRIRRLCFTPAQSIALTQPLYKLAFL